MPQTGNTLPSIEPEAFDLWQLSRYELHIRLLDVLKPSGRNALFGGEYDFSVGEAYDLVVAARHQALAASSGNDPEEVNGWEFTAYNMHTLLKNSMDPAGRANDFGGVVYRPAPYALDTLLTTFPGATSEQVEALLAEHNQGARVAVASRVMNYDESIHTLQLPD